jgi:hypothetical protein
MKLDKDPFLANKNIVELDGKNVLVWPSQAESTKGKEIVIGEERQPRMIRPKNPEIGRWKKNERSKPRSRPKVTFGILMAKYRDGNADIMGCKNWTIGFPVSGQYFCGRKLVQQPIQDTAMTKFRRSGSSSTGVSSDVLLLDWATNAWAVEASADDVSALSTLGRVVGSMDSATNALPPKMVRTC